ncbi:MAG: hypothetical protein A4E28_02422 [Methanocella sp. PtaU1.Bin125]|nr:MAG: hypothetical protein A4E28_02422 [Methanocella sp. PtaU1.Bin125]
MISRDLQRTVTDPCQGCPRRHQGGCTVAIMGLQCPRGLRLAPCDLCEQVLPAHQLHNGLCADCAMVLKEETRENPRSDVETVPPCDICPPRCY